MAEKKGKKLSILDKKRLVIAISIFVGTAIGAGVLGLPYVAAQSGFMVAAAYIIIIGMLILTVNLYLGEISLRTKGNHQLPGYAKKYLGEKWKKVMQFATMFGIYAAIIAYMLGVGESISFLIFKTSEHTATFGVLFGLFMSGIFWKGIKGLKRFERIGVTVIISLLFIIMLLFSKDINIENLKYLNFSLIFLPFGVVLFSFMSFPSIPEINEIIKKDKFLMKRVLFNGTFISMSFYLLFILIVVGFKGAQTPEIATLALGPLFIILGIFTMFTSYLALGNALGENLKYDKKFSRRKSWFISSIIPIFIFLGITLFEFFSFTKILSIGGIVSGGLIAVLILAMVRKSKEKGDRIPEYSIPSNKIAIGLLSLIFILGVIREIILAIR